jgi:hypothetical protein
MKFGPSGLLKKEIEEGSNPDIFASANMNHPESLASKGWGGPVVVFARNTMCALTQPDLAITTNNFLAALIDEKSEWGHRLRKQILSFCRSRLRAPDQDCCIFRGLAVRYVYSVARGSEDFREIWI